jgi:threonyl-tRNA synthetase
VCAGELELWNKAEAALEEALNSTGHEWVMNPGDGAFYGPKIDITGAAQLAAARESRASALGSYLLDSLHTYFVTDTSRPEPSG